MKLPYYKWFPRDFHSDPNVKRLSALARGCYRDILDFMWIAQYGYKIPDNDRILCSQLNLRPSQWKKVKEELMDPFGPVFILEGGFLISNRLKAEYDEACATVEKNTGAGKKSAEVRRKAAKADQEKRQRNLFPEDNNESCNKEVAKTNTGKPVAYLPPDKRELGAYDDWLPTNKFNSEGEVYIIRAQLIAQMGDTYPAVDVLSEIKKMYSWCVTNATKRKTHTGIGRFINSWMSGAQNDGGSNKRYASGNNSPADNAISVGEQHRQKRAELRTRMGFDDLDGIDDEIEESTIIEGECRHSSGGS